MESFRNFARPTSTDQAVSCTTAQSVSQSRNRISRRFNRPGTCFFHPSACCPSDTRSVQAPVQRVGSYVRVHPAQLLEHHERSNIVRDIAAVSSVERYYDREVETEWARLDQHRTELAVTLRVLRRHLPAPPASVLDIGGGPGRYAIELARDGYDVTLLDLSKRCLDFAKAKAEEHEVHFEACIQANAIHLESLKDSSFDAVLLMGPLYHLTRDDERRTAVLEALRVLRPGGPLFSVFISRFAPARDAAANYPEWLFPNRQYAAEVLASGVNDRESAFTKAYFAKPEEIAPFLESCGLSTIALVGCEGVVAGHEAKINELSGDDWDHWVDVNARLGEEPSLLGASDHILHVGRKTV